MGLLKRVFVVIYVPHFVVKCLMVLKKLEDS